MVRGLAVVLYEEHGEGGGDEVLAVLEVEVT